MMPHFEGQFFLQTIDERGAVAVAEPDATDLTLLGMAVWEGQGLRPLELAPERLVAALRRLDDLVVQRAEVVLHAAKRGLHGAFQRRIDLGHGRRHGGDALVDFSGHVRERLFDGRRKLILQKLIERCFVARGTAACTSELRSSS